MMLIGDNLDLLRRMPSQSVNLVMTSPPYAQARSYDYGGVDPDRYAEWFLPRSAELMRVLAADGSFVLNIQEGYQNGRRMRYVRELSLALEDQGWVLLDDYIWHKTNGMPGQYNARLANAWEHCWHFAPTTKPKFRREGALVPLDDKTTATAQRIMSSDWTHASPDPNNSRQKINKGRVGQHALERGGVYHRNVITGTAAGGQAIGKGHSAVFPLYLPEFFIKLLTDEHDLVLDIFAGSGTTLTAATKLRRHALGFDIHSPKAYDGPVAVAA